MHAVFVHANISDLAAAKQGVDEVVLPTMREAPGFVAAYFVAVDDSHGISIGVFETEEQARASAPPKGAEAPGVTLAALQFGEVIGWPERHRARTASCRRGAQAVTASAIRFLTIQPRRAWRPATSSLATRLRGT
jgi:hypothetical protein